MVGTWHVTGKQLIGTSLLSCAQWTKWLQFTILHIFLKNILHILTFFSMRYWERKCTTEVTMLSNHEVLQWRLWFWIKWNVFQLGCVQKGYYIMLLICPLNEALLLIVIKPPRLPDPFTWWICHCTHRPSNFVIMNEVSHSRSTSGISLTKSFVSACKFVHIPLMGSTVLSRTLVKAHAFDTT